MHAREHCEELRITELHTARNCESMDLWYKTMDCEMLR